MRTTDLHNDAGMLTGFEIANIGRRRACRIAAKVPRARIHRAPRLFRSSADDFCAFEVDKVRFLIIEPFGDNSRYWTLLKSRKPVLGLRLNTFVRRS
jgi:hypothetical protein